MIFVFWDRVSLYHPGWSTIMPSQLTANLASGSSNSPASASGVVGIKEITGMCHHAQLIFVWRQGFTMLARLVSNFWPPVIHLPWPPKQSAGITGMCRCACLLKLNISNYKHIKRIMPHTLTCLPLFPWEIRCHIYSWSPLSTSPQQEGLPFTLR